MRFSGLGWARANNEKLKLKELSNKTTFRILEIDCKKSKFHNYVYPTENGVGVKNWVSGSQMDMS